MNSKKRIKIILLASGVLFFLAFHWARAAEEGIKFEPNVLIPNTLFNKESIMITNSSLAEYIVSLYKYGASFAGFVAMFMLVYAGWQWLMAGGSAGKISQAKNTINGVLIGLALLFGSYLLMSQISSRLVNFDPLNISPIDPLPGMGGACDQYLTPKETSTPSFRCGSPLEVKNDKVYGNMVCYSNKCDNASERCVDKRTGADCPKSASYFDEKNKVECGCVSTDCAELTLTKCEDYGSITMCEQNTCLHKTTKDGTVFEVICKPVGGVCRNVQDIKLPKF